MKAKNKLSNRISGNFPELDQDDISLQLPQMNKKNRSINNNRQSMNAPITNAIS